MRSLIHRPIAADAARFLLAGVANTLATLAIYEALLFVLPSSWSYALSWVCGVAFVVIVYPSRVFAGARTDGAARVTIGAIYLAVFLIGLGTLRLLELAGIPSRLAVVAVLGVTTVANFIFGRVALNPTVRSADLDEMTPPGKRPRAE